MGKQIIFMYHSIESEEIPSVIGSFPLSFEKFKNHISLAMKHQYKFDFISNFHKNKNSCENYIYITGDDGTRDWTRNILPWCEKNKIPTHTGIITGPLEKNPIYPLTHIIQIILLTRDEKELEKLCNKLKNDYLSFEQLEYINKIYFYEELEYRRVIKGSFNLILEKEKSYEVLGKLQSNEYQFLEERFENIDFYKNFQYAEIGVHTKSHWALGNNIEDYIKNEILASKIFLEENRLNPTTYYVSPMKPRHGAKLEDLVEKLKEYGFDAILDSNNGVWNKEDYIIPRIDCKNMPH